MNVPLVEKSKLDKILLRNKQVGYQGVFFTLKLVEYQSLLKQCKNIHKKPTQEAKENSPPDEQEAREPNQTTEQFDRNRLFKPEYLLYNSPHLVDPYIAIHPDIQMVQELCEQHGLHYGIKILVEESNEQKLLKTLQRTQKYRALLALQTEDQNCMLLGARDSRIQILQLATTRALATFDKGVLSLCRQHNTYVEIGLQLLLHAEQYERPKIMRRYSQFFSQLTFSKDKVIVGTHSNSEYDTRGVKGGEHLLKFLFGIPIAHSKDYFQNYCEELVAYYLLRVNDQLAEQGVLIYRVKMEESHND